MESMVQREQDGVGMPSKKLRVIVTATALLLALGHLIFPNVAIDFVTLVLLVLAVIPWLAPIIKSVELPGGFKIQLQDMEKATRELLRADAAIQPVTDAMEFEGRVPALRLEATGETNLAAEVMNAPEAVVESLRNVAGTDPNLALVGFRIEIERRLRDLAMLKGLEPSTRISAMLRELGRRELLPLKVSSALKELIYLGNRAAHGVTVEPQAAEWVFDEGPEVLAALDHILRHQ